jgi:acetylornithine deacetylase
MRGPIYTAQELLARLVAFDTTSHKSNLPLVAFVEDYLLQHGIVSHRVPSGDGEKASLFATIGPGHTGGIALSGHTDVVPVDGQTWDSDPFTLREAEGRLYGRGSSDMKGFLACVLAAVPNFKQRRLKTPIHIVFSYDEEIGCLGVRPMLAEFGKTLPKPRLVVVGEPTSMQVVDAHKGPVRWQVEVTGRAAHSSMAHIGVNAVSYATRLIGELDRIEAELKVSSCNDRFEPPYATLQVTRIDGGTAAASASMFALYLALTLMPLSAASGHLPKRPVSRTCNGSRQKPTLRSPAPIAYRRSPLTRTPRLSPSH